MYNFDIVKERRGTGCIKYDFAAQRGRREGLLPLWVADMDFDTADCIKEKLHSLVSHGIFGYTESGEEYYNAVSSWYEKYFSWKVKKEWLVKTPGVVYAIAMAIQAYTREGDAVLIQEPVYYPFSETIRDNKRKLVSSPLLLKDGRYEMNFEELERLVRDEDVKLMLLCSPHNPVGRVWEREELERLGDICLKYRVIVLSDEIHSDFVYPGHKHTVFSAVKKEYENISVVCTAPSKSFNLAGLQVSNIWIADETLRKKFIRARSASGYSQLNMAGLAACQAAYEGGREWLEEVKNYIYENLNYVREFINGRMPYLKLIEPEGTYLIWIDCRELGLDNRQRRRLIEDEAGLWLDEGEMFGKPGEGFERINIACPRQVLKQAMEQLETACARCARYINA